MAKTNEIEPVKLAELKELAASYQIDLNIRGMNTYKEVHVSRGRMKQYPWRKFILRLKAAGFTLIEGQGQWYNALSKSGKRWQAGLFGDFTIPA